MLLRVTRAYPDLILWGCPHLRLNTENSSKRILSALMQLNLACPRTETHYTGQPTPALGFAGRAQSLAPALENRSKFPQAVHVSLVLLLHLLSQRCRHLLQPPIEIHRHLLPICSI